MTMNNTSKKWNKSQYFSGSQSIFGEVSSSRFRESRINIAIGDIDFFKQVNDTYGHEAGDVVLQKLGEILQEYMSKSGLIARWGGEEFLFVFYGINGDESMHKLEELRKMIAAMQIEHENQIIRITITLGLQEHMAGDSVEHTIIEADKKLYIGKQTGRNRVVF